MNKYRILVRFYDRIEGLYYEPSNSFVEVPDHVAKRFEEIGDYVAIKEKANDKSTSTKIKTNKQPKD